MEVDQTIFYLYNSTEYQVNVCIVFMLVCVIINVYIITIIYDTFVDYDGSVKREVVADIEIGLNGSKFVFREGESINTLWECERINWYIDKDIFLYPIMSPLADKLFIAVFVFAVRIKY